MLEGNHLVHTAGCYPVPIRFLYGTAAEINFWDVVCFRRCEAGGPFDASTEELAEQMGLSRQVLGKLRREAVEQGELIEDVSWVSGRRFTLQIPGSAEWTKGIIWKPLGYVRNGWHHAVTPAIPKRVLNLYLQQPRQRVYQLDPATLAARCRRQFLYDTYRPVAPINQADIGKALRLLVRLGLLVPLGDGFSVDWTAFNRPGSAAPRFDEPDPRTHALFCQAAAADPGRAEWALELLDVGQYDMETHFADIFRDLAYVRQVDYTLLKAKVYRRRNRPPTPSRWRDTWKAFQYELKRRVAETRTPKMVLNLSETTSAACPLRLEIGRGGGRVLAVRMVSRVEWPWYFEDRAARGPSGEAGVRLELRLDGRLLFARTVSPGDAEVRHTVQPGDAPLTLSACCDRPLPGVHVEAWLEARLRR